MEADILIQETARTAIGTVTAPAALDAREGSGIKATARAHRTACLAWQDLCALAGELAALVTAGRGCAAGSTTVAGGCGWRQSHNPVKQNKPNHCQENSKGDT